eukprot:3522975-Prymnesium_polylepis.1
MFTASPARARAHAHHAHYSQRSPYAESRSSYTPLKTNRNAGRHGAPSGQAGTCPLATGGVQVCIMLVCSECDPVPTCHSYQ